MLEGDAKARQVFCDALRLDDRVEPGSDRVSSRGRASRRPRRPLEPIGTARARAADRPRMLDRLKVGGCPLSLDQGRISTSAAAAQTRVGCSISIDVDRAEPSHNTRSITRPPTGYLAQQFYPTRAPDNADPSTSVRHSQWSRHELPNRPSDLQHFAGSAALTRAFWVAIMSGVRVAL